ncbi:hypothetical protein ACH34E_17735 [Elizabethkingia anophelis]
MKTKLFKPLLGAFLLAFMLNSCKRDITSEGETNPQARCRDYNYNDYECMA